MATSVLASRATRTPPAGARPSSRDGRAGPATCAAREGPLPRRSNRLQVSGLVQSARCQPPARGRVERRGVKRLWAWTCAPACIPPALDARSARRAHLYSMWPAAY